jgi:23S rRNA (uridine2552-2'-O)-methyltransferase
MATYEPRDQYYRKARALGLPSRAAFKIEELIAHGDLVRKGGRVVDLGCAPGGWLKILVPAVGPGGLVVGVDLAELKDAPQGVITIAGDVRDAAISERVAQALGGKADLVTSDLAPKLTGIAVRDEARSHELVAAALDFATRALAPQGAMIAKIFMSADFNAIVGKFKEHFAKVEVKRTKASRPGSAELYVIARDFIR